MQKTYNHSFHQNFTFLDWDLDSSNHQLNLHYSIDGVGQVTETLEFPTFEINKVNQTAINSACELIHLMCGISYYKSGLAKKILCNKLPHKNMADFIEKTWYHGLGELAFDSNISLKNHIKFPYTKEHSSLSENINLSNRSLVPLGGGKDSLVTIEELKEQGKEISLFMVGNAELIKQVAGYINLPLVQVKRKIDPKLIQYNNTGNGFNGHVPITAINSSISVLTALLFDFNEIVFSNEKSADSANTINADGDEVNHQYSKSSEFEKDFSKILSSEISTNIKYYSQQRNFSELEILEKFSNYPQYFSVFSSCNRNFHIHGSQNEKSKWCNNCPKCRFVFLGLAPFVEKSKLISIFKHNLLDDNSQMQGFSELLGIQGFKPFECVGEISESIKAFDSIKNIMNKESLTTVSLLWPESLNLFHSRNPFPTGGIYEDAATGAAAAALAGYLRDIQYKCNNSFEIIQGEDMGCTSRLLVEYTDEIGSSIKVSGETRYIIEKNANKNEETNSLP